MSDAHLALERLERKLDVLRQEVRAMQERLDTVASPPWKRLWWFIRGYRLWRVGRWYGKTSDLK